ncbi:MAG: nucleotide exchange factor GrpE [Candidatus Hodarchaeota archaeon]
MSPTPKKRSGTPTKKDKPKEQVKEEKAGKPSMEVRSEVSADRLEQTISEAKNEVENYKVKLAYMQAEHQNYVKSMEKRETQLRLQANRDLILRLLPILDDLERAQIMIPHIEANEPFIRGLQMVVENLKSTFTDAGVTRIICKGQPFDPLRHEAVVREESTDNPPNTVLEELRKGYLLKGELLRPAMVKIAIAPKPTPTEKASALSENKSSQNKGKNPD